MTDTPPSPEPTTGEATPATAKKARKRAPTRAQQRAAIRDEAVEKLRAAESALQSAVDTLTEKEQAAWDAYVQAVADAWSGEEDEVNVAIEQVTEAQGSLTDLASELEEVRSNMEERFSSTERYSRIEEAASTVETEANSLPDSLDALPDVNARDEVESFLTALGEARDTISSAADNLDGVDFEFGA